LRLKAEESVFKKIGLDYKMLDSGCCGMAGSFGFESDKYDLSVKVGERVLLPAVRGAEASRQALHTAEVLSLAMKRREFQDQQRIEREIVRRRDGARKRSMLKPATLTAVTVGGALALLLGRRK